MSDDFGYYSNGTAVRVAVPGDPNDRRVGKVERSYNDAGDMVHVVRFDGDETADYTTEELRSAQHGDRWHPKED